MIRRQMQSLSGVGIVLGALFFAAALAPTLVPRSYLTQGVLAGGCFAIGYAAGIFWRWLWHYLELPEPSARIRSITNAIVAAASLFVVVIFLWRAAQWQNSIRTAMGMAPVDTAHPLEVCAIALVTFIALLALARLFWLVTHTLSMHIQPVIPRRVANVIGVIVATRVFWSIANGLLVRTVFRALDSSYREFDALLEPERPQPTDRGRTGSAASVVKWDELGRAGREFVASGPTAEQISAFTGRSARQPVRVYV